MTGFVRAEELYLSYKLNKFNNFNTPKIKENTQFPYMQKNATSIV
jgi:hypothetical protein